jgi:hypothetical protein
MGGMARLGKAQDALDKAVKRWHRRGGPIQARRAIKLIEEAIGRRKKDG